MDVTRVNANTDVTLAEIGGRIRELREIAGYTVEQMADMTGNDLATYVEYEDGLRDMPFTFIHACVKIFNVEITDLLEGRSAKLSTYTVTRSGAGQVTAREDGIEIVNLAPEFTKKIGEPFRVCYAYSEELQNKPIRLTVHSGHEFDLIISGHLRVQVGSNVEDLGPGDSIYFNATIPNGMLAIGGEDCHFLAVVLPGEPEGGAQVEAVPEYHMEQVEHAVWEKFVKVQENENGTPTKVEFVNADRFNFAFDVVDAVADKDPDRLAMLHLDVNKFERRITFGWMKKESARAANYLLSLGIERGDRVMLILRRNYQFWPIICALHKIGAVAVPATDQLLEHDLEYRFNAIGIKAVVCTNDSLCWQQVEMAMEKSPSVQIKVMTNGVQPGWHDFDTEYKRFRSIYDRAADAPCGNDTMLMYFTSGTSGYPKVADHSYKYALGHFTTAKYWHNVHPDGLHFTISDTGWGKAVWGKLYGQWMCEAAVFTYDFDRFKADDLMPLFAKYQITTFCAPPTMYRMFIKEDLSKYDLSSIKYATTAGEALNPEVFNQFKKATGLSIMEGFGQTETTLTIANLVGTQPKVGSMGRANPIYEIALMDREGNLVPNGETGEIVINTKNGAPCGLYKGYTDAQKTAEAWHDGWYHTGDTAWRDEDGYFWYVGRADDIIKSSGYRIGPFEIESVIMELPYVLECGVSAAPDPVRGQVVKASIVLTKGTEGTEELKKEIQNYVKSHTAPYKYPRIVVFRDSLPKSISGKIQHQLL